MQTWKPPVAAFYFSTPEARVVGAGSPLKKQKAMIFCQMFTPTTVQYHDALANKRSTVVLFLVELSGALSPPAKRHLRWLAARAKRRDRTPSRGPLPRSCFMSYWLQRISAAIVGGDARRAFTAISKRAGLLT